MSADAPGGGSAASQRAERIQAHLGLVKHVALRIARRLPSHMEVDDLISAGTLGLIDAVDKLDRARAENFVRYAKIRIKGAILDELRTLDHATRTHRRGTSALDRAVHAAEGATQGPASQEDVAQELGIGLADLHALRDKLRPVYVVSLETLGLGDRDGSGRDPLETLPDPASPDPHTLLHFKRLHALLNTAIDGLPESQRMAMRLYYYEDMKLKEIGRVLEVSESRVSQVITQATQVLGKRIRGALRKDLKDTSMID